MYKFEPFIKYEYNGRIYENSKTVCDNYRLELSVTDGGIQCTLVPHVKMKLIEFRISSIKKFEKGELFFANGYQSWTTSREFGANDTLDGVSKLAGISSATKALAEISGDYSFAQYGKKGVFHSYTYTYFRLGDSTELFGSRNERYGYTVFSVNYAFNQFTIAKDVDGLETDDEIILLDIVSFSGGCNEVFDKYFGSMDLRKPKVDHLSGYTSWYNYFQKIDEKIILRDLDGLDRARDSVSIFQIDDGYESKVGDWLVPDYRKFPNGMKPIADAIHGKGYLAGIWIAPFSAQKSSVIAKDHPEWLIKNNATGKPLLGCFGWGGAYTLDFYNDEAREYIRRFFSIILNDWGFDMVKLDFLYSEAMQPRNGKSRGQIMCEAMDFLRDCVGEDKLILGCGVPLGPSFGVVDACRISCDVDLKYSPKYYNKLGINLELPSAQNAITNSVFRRQLNGRVFCNDPDVFFLRDKNLTFTKEQKHLLGKINNLCGDVLFVSDNAGDYSDEDIELLKKFFKKNNSVITSAGFINENDIRINYTEGGTKKTLEFNLSTGKSNVEELI